MRGYARWQVIRGGGCYFQQLLSLLRRRKRACMELAVERAKALKDRRWRRLARGIFFQVLRRRQEFTQLNKSHFFPPRPLYPQLLRGREQLHLHGSPCHAEQVPSDDQFYNVILFCVSR